MPKSDIDDVISKMQNHSFITVHAGTTKSEIRRVLRVLKVRLPNNYIAFLLKCGWADINGDVLYGLGHKIADRHSMFEQALSESVDMQPPMPHRLIPLMSDGAGNHECLDTSKINGDDCPVVLWQHDHPRGELQVPKRVSASFTAWLAKKVREAPEV